MDEHVSIVESVDLVVADVVRLKITDAESYGRASAELMRIKRMSRNVEDAKAAVMRPLLDATKAERSRWQPMETALANAETWVKGKMLDYVNAVEAAAQAQAEAIENDKRIKRPETLMQKIGDIEQAPTTASSVDGMTTVRKVRVARIVEPLLVPDEYWVIDEVRVRRAALDGAVIPGVVVEYQNTIAGFTS